MFLFITQELRIRQNFLLLVIVHAEIKIAHTTVKFLMCWLGKKARSKTERPASHNQRRFDWRSGCALELVCSNYRTFQRFTSRTKDFVIADRPPLFNRRFEAFRASWFSIFLVILVIIILIGFGVKNFWVFAHFHLKFLSFRFFFQRRFLCSFVFNVDHWSEWRFPDFRRRRNPFVNYRCCRSSGSFIWCSWRVSKRRFVAWKEEIWGKASRVF